MSYRAARRWLIALSLLTAGELAAQTPDREGVAHHSPAVKAQAERGAHGGGAPPEPLPVPVRIIQSHDEAAHDAAQEAKAEQHDAEDLDAQIRAANAAEEQIPTSRWAVFLSAIATILLLWTLWETRKTAKAAAAGVTAAERAAKAAEGAIEVAQNTASRQLRAYVLADNPILEEDSKEGFLEVQIELRNSGQTPAYRLKPWVEIEIRTKKHNENVFFTGPKAESNLPIWDVGPNGRRTVTLRRDGSYFLNKTTLRSELVYVYAFGGIDYVDCFGRPQTGTFSFFLPVEPNISAFTGAAMNHAERGNQYS